MHFLTSEETEAYKCQMVQSQHAFQLPLPDVYCSKFRAWAGAQDAESQDKQAADALNISAQLMQQHRVEVVFSRAICVLLHSVRGFMLSSLVLISFPV